MNDNLGYQQVLHVYGDRVRRSSLRVGLRGSKPRETEAAHEKSLAPRVIRYEFIICFNATVFEAAKRSQSRW